MPWPGTKSSSAWNGPLPIGRAPQASGRPQRGGGAGRPGPEGLRIVEEGGGQRVEGVVAGDRREVGERRGQRDREGALVDDGQAAHLLGGRLAGACPARVARGLHVGIALDAREVGGRALGVRAEGGVVPGVDEGLRVDRRPVVEGPAVLERDGPGGVVLGLDGLGDAGVVDLALLAVAHEAGPQRADDLVTFGLGGVAGDERVLGLADVHAEGATGAALTAPAATGTARAPPRRAPPPRPPRPPPPPPPRPRTRRRRRRRRRTAAAPRTGRPPGAPTGACSTSRALPPPSRSSAGHGPRDAQPAP